MEDQYQNKYRVSSARLSGWDYGYHGLYFVTICTKDRVHYFGEIENNISKMQSSKTRSPETRSIASLQINNIGKIAHQNWLQIPEYHPYVELDEFVIMPDHIHGILFINNPDKQNWELNKFGSQSKNLASIMRGYKSSVKQYTAINNIEFGWQPRYYDRIIRNEKEYQNIREYIYDNPDSWLSKNDHENLFLP